MTISEILEKLGDNKKQANDLYKQYKELKEDEESLKTELSEMLDMMGLKSAKGEHYTASISDKPDIQITHEQSVINWLNETPNVEADAYIGLKKTEFKGLALQILKETGEIVPGTELLTKEVLSIRSNKK